MMDTLISGFAEDYRRQFINSDSNNDQLDHSLVFPSGSFTNKLSKFTLATFDDEGNETILDKIVICRFINFLIILGRCIGQMGSWSFR